MIRHAEPEPVTVEIPEDFSAEADRIIARYPVSKRSASLMLLHQWQEKFGFITDQSVQWISGRLGIQPIHVLELVTFYPMFRQHAAGRFHIRICRTLSCALAGSYELFEAIRQRIGAEGDGHGVAVSKDGLYSIEFVECLAACGTAPVMMVNDDFYEQVNSPAKASEILAKYRE